MRAGQTLLMVFPGDTDPYPVPRELAAKARLEGAKFYGPNYTPPPSDPETSFGRVDPTKVIGRSIAGGAQRAVNATPDVMGAAGGFMGFTPHQRAANAARFGVAGRAISHDINALTGAEESWTPEEAVRNLSKEAAMQSAMAYTGEGIAGVGKKLAEPVMKSAIGRAAVGSAKKALKYGLAPTEKFLEQTTAKIAKLKEQAVQMAQKLEDQGHTTTFDALAAPIRKAMARYKKHDVTGKEAERAMQMVLDEMESKIGPTVVTTPAGPSIGATTQQAANPNSNLRGVFTTQWKPATSTTIPAAPLTPTQLQNINQIARQKLTELFEAKQGKIGVPPDPRELAYMKVWARSKQLLEEMGGPQGKEIGRLNKEMQRLYQMHSLARKAGERAAPITSPWEAAAAGGIAAGSVASGHPAAALLAVPTAIGRSMLTRPDALAAQARFLNGPGFAVGSRLVPRIPVALYNQLQQQNGE